MTATDAADDLDRPVLPETQRSRYPRDLMIHYCRKFGLDEDRALASQKIRDLLRAKIDSDIFIRQLQAKNAELEEQLSRLRKRENFFAAAAVLNTNRGTNLTTRR
jgi:hypothetical protein